MNPDRERVVIAGLPRLGSWIFFVAGGLAAVKGVWDLFIGQPEANYFSPAPWQFVTREQWSRYAGFELTFGLACLAVGAAARTFARRLPAWVEREKLSEEIL
jgi:hypothetical protein